MPLQSMTSYGFGEAAAADLQYSIEVRTLNSRYIEVNVRMPRHLVSLETEMIAVVKKKFHRGKVDVFVDINRDSGARDLPDIDLEAVKHYAGLFDKLQETLSETLVSNIASMQDPAASDFFRLEGVLRNNEKKRRGPEAADEHRDPLLGALTEALAQATDVRQKEGASMQTHLSEMLGQLETEREHVAAKRDDILTAIHDNYHKKIQALYGTLKTSAQSVGAEIPEDRIAQEIVILTDKADIEEELARLKTHCVEFANYLNHDDAIGRKLDFLCQEMHREVNTMTNKLVQTEVSKHTLSMKQIVERIRQQVQNIE